jgi:hypothetical protein
VTAAEALTRALVELVDRGERTPCQGRRRDRWTSDCADDRAWAASVCRSLACPLLTQCRAAADEGKEKFGVWAGVDRTATAPCRKAPHPRPDRNLIPANTTNGLQEPTTEKDPQ